ncbi:anoctamin-10-like [Ylistrum balloti]|uniref:anoctamin-10-like n=1 Tax=Ylistrum balloti TaxID=509963 RepID=UPI0029058A57|nr:anoctamin-10-like [Ylistrum balloti]
MSRVTKPRKKVGTKANRLGTLLEASIRFKQTLKKVRENADKKKSEKRIDMVLVHQRKMDDEKEDAEETRERERRNVLRECFEKRLKQEQFRIKEKQHGQNVYTMLHCSFERLCKEAEIVNLEMRLDSKSTTEAMRNMHMTEKAKRMSARQEYTGEIPASTSTASKQNWKPRKETPDNPHQDQCCGSFRGWLKQKETSFFDPDPEDIEDFESTPFIMDRFHIYKGHEDPSTFFRPSIRSLLVKHILINLDIREDLEAKNFPLKDEKGRKYITGKVTTSPYNYVTTTLAPNTTAPPEEVSSLAAKALEIIKSSFDNEVTPYFALIICVWGTLFLELWKQKSARCAYLWDVQEFEANEPDRPEFFSTTFKEDPVTKAKEMYFPSRKQNIRYLISFSTLMFMILIVLTSVVSIIIYRVITSVDYCPNMDATTCLLLTTVVSSVLNTMSILILGKVYDYMAVKLTDWENHRTQTMYDDALIIKLFAFQFANNYASSFYIAFFRGRFDYAGILGLGSEYRDSCEGTCMSQLSFQILTNMLLKPLPKVFSDIVKPLLIRSWRKRPSCMQGEKPELTDDLDIDERALHYPETLTFMDKEFMKPTLGDFTVGEYTEKIIQYGFLMLFAASLPLAPLIALLTLVIDIRVDAKRMLWWYRRPIAMVAQDIGTWFTILQVVNVCGVVSNGFIIAFTSSWGQQYDIVTQLWIAIGFEHIVFAIKFLLAYFIPDVPDDVALMMRKHQHWRTHQLAEILENDRNNEKETLKEALLQNIIKSEEEYRRRQSHGDGGDGGPTELSEPTYRDEEPNTENSRKESQQPVPLPTRNGQPPVENPEPFRGGPDPLTPPVCEVRNRYPVDHISVEEGDDDTHVRKMKKKKKKKDKRRKRYGDDQLIIDCDDYELEDQGVRSRRRITPLTPPLSDTTTSIQRLPGQLSFRVKGPRGEDLGGQYRYYHEDSVA